MSFTNTVMPYPDLCTPGGIPFAGSGNYFSGSRGCLLVNRAGYRLTPSRRGRPGTSQPADEPQPRKFDDRRENGSPLHIRNFLDCVKCRQKPICDIETGFYSTLPLLLALLAIQQGRSFAWGQDAAKPV
jgi:hypothetical protein